MPAPVFLYTRCVLDTWESLGYIGSMHQLTESIGKYLLAAVSPLIRHPEKAQLRVASTPEGDMVRFRLVLEQADVARVIGRNGMTASAIRSLAKAAGEKAGTKVVVHILSQEEVAADAV